MASMFLSIFSVQVLVALARSARFSKLASSSVFSDVPSVSSVSCAGPVDVSTCQGSRASANGNWGDGEIIPGQHGWGRLQRPWRASSRWRCPWCWRVFVFVCVGSLGGHLGPRGVVETTTRTAPSPGAHCWRHGCPTLSIDGIKRRGARWWCGKKRCWGAGYLKVFSRSFAGGFWWWVCNVCIDDCALSY